MWEDPRMSALVQEISSTVKLTSECTSQMQSYDRVSQTLNSLALRMQLVVYELKEPRNAAAAQSSLQAVASAMQEILSASVLVQTVTQENRRCAHIRQGWTICFELSGTLDRIEKLYTESGSFSDISCEQLLGDLQMLRQKLRQAVQDQNHSRSVIEAVLSGTPNLEGDELKVRSLETADKTTCLDTLEQVRSALHLLGTAATESITDKDLEEELLQLQQQVAETAQRCQPDLDVLIQTLHVSSSRELKDDVAQLHSMSPVSTLELPQVSYSSTDTSITTDSVEFPGPTLSPLPSTHCTCTTSLEPSISSFASFPVPCMDSAIETPTTCAAGPCPVPTTTFPDITTSPTITCSPIKHSPFQDDLPEVIRSRPRRRTVTPADPHYPLPRERLAMEADALMIPQNPSIQASLAELKLMKCVAKLANKWEAHTPSQPATPTTISHPTSLVSSPTHSTTSSPPSTPRCSSPSPSPTHLLNSPNQVEPTATLPQQAPALAPVGINNASPFITSPLPFEPSASLINALKCPLAFPVHPPSPFIPASQLPFPPQQAASPCVPSSICKALQPHHHVHQYPAPLPLPEDPIHLRNVGPNGVQPSCEDRQATAGMPWKPVALCSRDSVSLAEAINVTGANFISVDQELSGWGACLGRGAFGSVYKAIYKGKPVAVKMVRSDMADSGNLKSLTAEINALSSVKHPNIIRFHGYGFSGPQDIAIVEELMEFDLYDYIHRQHQDQVPLRDTLKIGLAIARGLEALHPAIVHRDLKPANVLMDRRLRVKIADFGLSRLKASTYLSTHNRDVGTLKYMAPECITNCEVNEKCDIYSFGALMYEIITGQEPWDGYHPLYAICQVQSGISLQLPEDSPSCPPCLHALITRCLAFNSDDRPTSTELVGSLQRLMDELKG